MEWNHWKFAYPRLLDAQDSGCLTRKATGPVLPVSSPYVPFAKAAIDEVLQASSEANIARVCRLFPTIHFLLQLIPASTERMNALRQILVTWLLIVICFVGYLWKSYGGLAASASSHHPALERIVHLLERHKADGDQAITSLTAPRRGRHRDRRTGPPQF